MSTETVSVPQKPRLNPFAFPSDTDFRFVLLIVTVLGVSISYFMILIDNKMPFVQQSWMNGVIACGNQVYGKGFDQFLNQVNNSDVAQINDAEKILMEEYYACTLPFEIKKTLWVLVGVALLIGIATVLFWIFPARIIFRNHLSPISDEDVPDVIEFLNRLCREVELKSPPKFLWNPLNNTCSGLAFGYSGKYYVAISGGLVTQFYTDPSAFRAILLHELAHLKNADVNKTYFATSIWQAFLVVAVLPVLIFCFGDLSVRNFIDLIVLIALVYLIRNSILRVRELYADARADSWDKKSALEMVLASLPRQQGSRWQVMKVHPTPSERRRILTDSEGYFQA